MGPAWTSQNEKNGQELICQMHVSSWSSAGLLSNIKHEACQCSRLWCTLLYRRRAV